MTGFAGGARVHIVAQVAGDATDALMHANSGAVVAGANLLAPIVSRRNRAGLCLARRMALVAEGLARILAHGHRASAIVQLRDGERGGGKVKALAAVVEGQ